jgi:hypothetical protein
LIGDKRFSIGFDVSAYRLSTSNAGKDGELLHQAELFCDLAPFPNTRKAAFPTFIFHRDDPFRNPIPR